MSCLCAFFICFDISDKMSGNFNQLNSRRLKSFERFSANANLSNVISQKGLSSDNVDCTIPKLKIPSLHIKALSTDAPTSSRHKLSSFAATKPLKPLPFSLIAQPTSSIRTSRARNQDFFPIPSKKSQNFPMSSQQALENFKNLLTDFETTEILQYKEIFFIGPSAKKILMNLTGTNYGYDNEKGDYKIVVNDHVDYRYEVLAGLGKGSFGQVCKCFDHKTKETVALKIIKNQKKFHRQGMVEVKILNHLRSQDPGDNYNVVRIKNSFLFRNHLCITFELLSMNLYEYIKLYSFQQMPMPLISSFALQILNALQYSDSLGIIHCDLKPENILLVSPEKSALKIIDYGSGCYLSERIYTYIQSRFYRAPEIMLGIPYTSSIDMWSFACVLVEVRTGTPLFPGENEMEQFARILEVLGTPPNSMIAASPRKKVFFDSKNKPKPFQNSRGKVRIPGTRPLQDVIGTEDVTFLSFISDILCWDPQLRPTPTDAIRHPFISKFFNKPERTRRKPRKNSYIEFDYTDM